MIEEKVCQIKAIQDFLVKCYQLKIAAHHNGFSDFQFWKSIDHERLLERLARALYEKCEEESKL